MDAISNNAVNVLSILGSDTSIRALRYQSIEKKRIWFSGYIFPGIFNVGQMLLTTQNMLIAKGLGSKDDYTKISLPYLNTDKLNKYTGIISGTIAPIETVYPEILLCMNKNEENINIQNNNFTITIISISEINYDEYLDGSSKYSYMGIIAFISNIIGIILCYKFNDLYISSLIIFNIFVNYILGIYFYYTNIKFCEKEVIEKSPKGDALVEINKQFIIIKGHEKYIQSLLQLPMIINDKQIIGVIAGILCIIAGILNVIIIPLGNIYGQLIIALLLLIGYITNVYFAAFDKNNLFNKLINSGISINYKKQIILNNRTSALGFLFHLYKNHAIVNCKHLIPHSMTWKKWYNNCINDNTSIVIYKEKIIEEYVNDELLEKLESFKNEGINAAFNFVNQNNVTGYYDI